MDAADDGEGDEAVKEGHEVGGAEDEEGGGSGETRDSDLGEGEEGVRDGDDSDGLHGLDRHWDAEEKVGGDVVESVKMRVVERSRWLTSVRVRTMGM